MIYKFTACGHPNILATHKTTLEFTKDNEMSLRGDCIVGVKADFDLKELENFMEKSKNKKIAITIETLTQNKKYKTNQETIKAEINPCFDSYKEIVIRKTNFVSEKTFAMKADKVAFDLNRELIRFLQKRENKIMIVIDNK